MSKKLISILMPVKNEEKYLVECIDSIVKQTEQNWELIPIDDHSTDSTGSILEDYARKDPRIRPHINNGSGVISALQTAYQKARGELITRMDADDIMTPSKLINLKTLLDTHGEGHLATGMVEYFAESDLGEGYRKYQDWMNNLMLTDSSFSEIYKECVIPSPCWMIHRVDFDRCNGFSSQLYPEDYDLTFRFYQNKLKVVTSKEILHFWRDYSDRTTRIDDRYTLMQHITLKLHYFLKLEIETQVSPILWGTGKKGKLIAKEMQKADQDFIWICNNTNKQGKTIYNNKIYSPKVLEEMNRFKVIIAVSSPNDQLEIENFLSAQNLIKSVDYFFFC